MQPQKPFSMEEAPHIAILPSPGMGHLIPIVEFAKRLVRHHNFSVTIIVPTTGTPPKAQTAVLNALPNGINYLFLAPVSLDDLPKDSIPDIQIVQTVTRSLSSLRDTLRSLISRTRLVALVADFFSTDAFDVAREFQISAYLFFPASAMSLSFSFYLPKLDEMVSCEYRDLPEPVEIPGAIPVHGKDLVDPVQDRSNDTYKWFLHTVKQFNLADGILLNSFMELEEGAIKAVQEEKPGRLPVYPIGPLIPNGSSSGAEQFECLEWLNSQPSGSVLFVSFGSGGTLSYDQFTELALGLEMSGQRFLWVVRTPDDKSSNAAFFGTQILNDPMSFLPKGFLDRTKGQGLVVPSWAPQIEVLNHSSTGGFLTHCGWNSTLESIVNGVPLIAWPLFAEQKMNEVMLTEGLKVALRPHADKNGLVGREEIEKVVKSLMNGEEGKRIRDKMKELQVAGMKALSEDGSSTKSLSKLAVKLKNSYYNSKSVNSYYNLLPS